MDPFVMGICGTPYPSSSTYLGFLREKNIILCRGLLMTIMFHHNHNHDTVTVSRTYIYIYKWTYDTELDYARTSPYSPRPINQLNMAQVDQSEIYDLVLDSDIQQYTYMIVCTLLVYDTRKYSTGFQYDIVSYSSRD